MSRSIRQYVSICLVFWLLVGCGLEGGALVPTPEPSIVPSPTAPPTIDIESLTDRLVFGMTEEPIDLYPYSFSSRATQPLIELLYPAPLVVINDQYTTTGILEQVPSFENGDVTYVTTTVFLDETGAITVNQTEVVSSVPQLTITYHWNQDVEWFDGEPVTAEDSVFAWELLQRTAVTPQQALQRDLTFDYVALDTYTTRAYLPPQIEDPNYLQTVWLPLPKHLFEADVEPQAVQERLARDPLGYGSYQLVEWNAGFQLDFIRSASANRDLPEQIVVQLYPDLETLRQTMLAGNLDLGWADDPPIDVITRLETASEDDIAALLAPTAVWEHLDMNLAVPELQDIRVRQAIAHGFNRSEMAQKLYGSSDIIWDSWIAPESWAFSDDITRYPYDLSLARSLLDDAGYVDQNNDGLRETPTGEPFELTLTSSDQTPLRQQISEFFVADMQELGIKINLQLVSVQELYSPQGPLFQRRFELAIFGWLREVDPNGNILWSCAAIPNEINNWTGDNFTGWCIDTADTAIRTATSTLDGDTRRAAYAEHQAIFSRELPVLPIFARQMLILARPGISGLQPDTFTPITWNLGSWTY